MRALTLGGLLALAAVGTAGAVEATNAEDGATTLAPRIAEVTVYADRARVTRTAPVVPAPETTRYAFRKLPGWTDEGSVRVGLSPAGAGELLDVQVLRTFLARPDDAAIRAAERAVLEMADAQAALDDQRAVLEAQGRQVDAIRAFAQDKLPKDAAAREVKIEEYDGVVKFIGKAMLEVAQAKRELEKKKRELQPELDARQRTLNELRQRAQLEQRTVLVTVKGGRGGPAELTLTCMLPGATWEPMHELRTDGGTGAVSIASFGMVTQTTGEDWEGAALTLSTQRSLQTIRIPELDALLLGGMPNLKRVLASGKDSFRAANDYYEQQWGNWNGVINPIAEQDELNRNWRFQKARQAENTLVFAALQEKRGTTEHFQALGRQTIRADGRPVRLPIAAAQFQAQPRLVAAPEVSLNAVRAADIVNTGKQPLLPGKVQLFVGGGFLGTTDADFVAPGESFPVFLGVADQIKLGRALDRKGSSLNWSGRRTRMQVSFVVTAENLGDKAVTLQLNDRVPVSQTEDIRVQSVRISPAIKPDVKGLLKWDVTLAPKEVREFRIAYELDYPTGLPQQAAADGAQPAAPRAKLQEEILNLERKLQ